MFDLDERYQVPGMQFLYSNLIYEKEDLLIDGGGKYPDYSFWEEAGVAVTHALGQGKQDEPPSDPRSNLP